MTGERWQGALTKKKHKKQDNYLLLIQDVYCSYVNFFFADPLQVAEHKANKQYKIHRPQGELKVKSQKQTSPHPHLERKKNVYRWQVFDVNRKKAVSPEHSCCLQREQTALTFQLCEDRQTAGHRLVSLGLLLTFFCQRKILDSLLLWFYLQSFQLWALSILAASLQGWDKLKDDWKHKVYQYSCK